MNKQEKALASKAESLFNVPVKQLLPIGESFSSDVIRFKSEHGVLVLKRPFTLQKAIREFEWLNRLDLMSRIPRALDFVAEGEQGYLLMEALPGLPVHRFDELEPNDLRQFGQDVRTIHRVLVDDFDGFPTWRSLLSANANRYVASISGPAQHSANRAFHVFMDELGEIPDTESATVTHFDLRQGNVLADKGQYQGIIDFESARGGHPSMDFFKLLTYPSTLNDEELSAILDGYGDTDWLTDIASLRQLIDRYKIYHGLGGLAWCSTRKQYDTEFYRRSAGFLGLDH